MLLMPQPIFLKQLILTLIITYQEYQKITTFFVLVSEKILLIKMKETGIKKGFGLMAHKLARRDGKQKVGKKEKLRVMAGMHINDQISTLDADKY